LYVWDEQYGPSRIVANASSVDRKVKDEELANVGRPASLFVYREAGGRASITQQKASVKKVELLAGRKG